MAGDAGDDKKPWERASKSARDAAADSAGQVKTLVDANVEQVKSLLGANVEQAKELTSSARVAIRKVGQQALNGLKDAVRPVVQVFEKAESKDGTELRKQISTVRVQLNEQLHSAQVGVTFDICCWWSDIIHTRLTGCCVML